MELKRNLFGAEKGLSQRPSQGEQVINAVKTQTSQLGFQTRILKTTLGERVLGCMLSSWTFFGLVGDDLTGWYFQNLNLLLPATVRVLVVSMWSPPTTWVKISVPTKQLKEMCQIVISPLSGGNSGTVTIVLIVNCSSLPFKTGDFFPYK